MCDTSRIRAICASVLLCWAVMTGCRSDDEPSREELCTVAMVRYATGQDATRVLVDEYCDD